MEHKIRRRFKAKPEKTQAGRKVVATELCKAAQGGDRQAMARMIELYYPLAIKNAKRYLGSSLDIYDLVQYALIGVHEAVKRYDGSHQFTTYVHHWIKARCIRGINEEGRMIRLPSNILQAASKARVKAKKGQELNDRETEALRSLEVTDISRMVMAREDDDKNGKQKFHRLDFMADPSPLPDTALDVADAKRQLAQFLTHLNPREAEVIRWRHGLDGSEGYTLAEIARMTGVSRERVRQIEGQAMGKMRKLAKNRKEKLFCES